MNTEKVLLELIEELKSARDNHSIIKMPPWVYQMADTMIYLVALKLESLGFAPYQGRLDSDLSDIDKNKVRWAGGECEKGEKGNE